MGRIKKEHDGYKSSGLWLRFQYPNIDDDETVTTKKKKNTRKWCKGKVGQHHDKKLVERSKWWFWTHEKYTCQNCKKTFLRTIR